MINSSGKNVELTFEQMQQIAVVEERLTNLVREIKIHEDKSDSLRGDNIKLEKHRVYLEEQNSQLEVVNKNLADKNTILTEAIVENNKVINDLENQVIIIKKGIAEEDQRIQKEKEDLENKKLDHSNEVKAFEKDAKKLAEKTVLVEKAHKALKEVVGSITL